MKSIRNARLPFFVLPVHFCYHGTTAQAIFRRVIAT